MKGAAAAALWKRVREREGKEQRRPESEAERRKEVPRAFQFARAAVRRPPSARGRKIKMADDGDDEYAGDDRRWEKEGETAAAGQISIWPFKNSDVRPANARKACEAGASEKCEINPPCTPLLARDLKFSMRKMRGQQKCSLVRSFLRSLARALSFVNVPSLPPPSIKILDE